MKLQPLQFIQTLTVDHAEYRFADLLGKTITVHIDYAGNSFSLKQNTRHSPDFLEEVKSLARGLLARKHAVNLAKKDHYLVK